MLSRREESGLALIMVMFIVALASMLVVNVTYSTYLGTRMAMTAEKSVQAEYMLKSALNYARVLIKEDKTTEVDSIKDVWGKYTLGIPLQQEDFINFSLPDVPILLEVGAEGAKFNLRTLAPASFGGGTSDVMRDSLERLFALLKVGSEYDGEVWYAPNGQAFEFTSKQMIANLIDYVDPDELPYDESGFTGVEGPNSFFPNVDIERLEQLAAVPGFTASRVSKIIPYLSTSDLGQVNINLAAKPVIMSLAPDIDETIADAVINYRNSEEGPFTNALQLENIHPALTNVSVAFRSNRFQVISKVETSTSVFFLRAELERAFNELPKLKSLELY